MQVGRLFEMIYLLQSRKHLTAKELAAHFEVSVRTVLRDVQTLSDAGVPLYTTQGKGGGICILDNYVLNKTVLSEAEQDQILFALQSVHFTDHPDTGATLDRLRALFDRADASWIEVDFARWGNAGDDRAHFDLLRQAILAHRAVRLSYAADGHTGTRTVFPLKLLYKARGWYLQAHCQLRQDYRTFKISRILDASLLDDRFDPASFTAPPLESMSPHVPLTQLLLRFSPEIAFRAYDEFDASVMEQQPDGSLLVCVSLPENGWLYGYLLSFGTSMQVLSPPSVQQRLRDEIVLLQNLYT